MRAILEQAQMMANAQQYQAQTSGMPQPPSTSQTTVPYGQPEVPEEFDYDKPAPSVARIAEKVVEARMRDSLNRTYQELALTNFNVGRSMAQQTKPDLFRGVENEAAQYIWGLYNTGHLRPANLANPETWYQAAWAAHAKKSNYQFPAAVSPVQPTPTEIPQGGGRSQFEPQGFQIADVDESIHTDAMLAGFGKTKEQVAELMRKKKGGTR
jgi:hypothetical protein